MFTIVMNIAIIWLLYRHVSTFVFGSKHLHNKCLWPQPVHFSLFVHVCACICVCKLGCVRIVVGVNLIFYLLLCNI